MKDCKIDLYYIFEKRCFIALVPVVT